MIGKAVGNWIVAIAFVASVGGAMMSITIPQTVSAKPIECNQGFLGFPAWYRGLTDDKCDIKSPSGAGDGLSNFIWHIVFNVVEIFIMAVAYLSGFYFIYGGFLFIVSQGKPDGAAKARSTLLEALIGLIISLAAVTIINFIVDGLLG